MKLLCTADIHIRNYSKFTRWDRVIPERLKINIDLANDIVAIADAEDVGAIIIAGDLLDIAVSPPMVLNIVDRFLNILSYDNNVYFTHGQHDISTKTVDEYLRQLTSLTIFESNKVRFAHNEVVHLGDVSAFFYGWSGEEPEFKDADIFIGHNIVKGSRNVLNYIFQTGYDPKFLSEKYKFSVIGDIHQSQVFYDNVLIPGPPIQNSFKDSPDTGVWIIDTDDWSYKFCPLTSTSYPRFYYVDNKSEIPENKPDNFHFQLSPQNKQKDTTDKIQTSNVSLDLWGIIESTVKTVKDSRQAFLVDLAKNVYDEGLTSPIETRFLPQVLVKSIAVKNFFSVKSLFLEIPEGVVSITGDIGSGKSTLLDAMCYGFYGVTTKGKFKDDIIPLTYKFDGDPQVIIDYSIGDISYRVDRSLNSLKFEINGYQLSGSRMADTQKMIEDTIQLSYAEYSCLVYFSQESGSFFGNLSNSQQMSLMTMFLSQQDQYLDKMISLVATAHKKYMSETLKLEGSIENLTIMNERNLQRYNECRSYQVSLRDRQIEVFNYSPYKDCPIDVVDLIIENKTTDAINKYFNIDYEQEKKRLTALKDQKLRLSTERFNSELTLVNLKSELNKIESEVPTLVRKLKSYKSGVCPECKQKLPTDETQLEQMIAGIQQFNIRKGDITAEYKPLAESVRDVIALIPSYDDKIKELESLIYKCDDFRSKRQQEIPVDQAEMNILKSSIDEFDVQKKELESQKESYQELYELYEILHKKVFNDKGIKARCVEYIGQHLSAEVNSLLESIDTDLRLTINTVTYNKSGGLSSGFDVKGNFNGVDINYRNASGGQKMLIDTAAIVSIYNLLSSMYNLPLGIFSFMAMDESIKYLDSRNIDTVKDIVGCIRAKTVFIVSHDEKLSAILSDRSISVKLENGISSYQLV